VNRFPGESGIAKLTAVMYEKLMMLKVIFKLYRTYRPLSLAILLTLLTMPSQAFALQDCMDPSRIGPDHYMHSGEVDLLGPPPAPRSPAGQMDLQAVLDAQRTRTPAEIASARADACFSIFAFADVMGPGFEPNKLPFTVGFFQRVFDDGMRSVEAPKDHFDRPRPFVADKAVTPVVSKPNSASYPSGHATFAYMTAILLADMVPEKSAAIFGRATDFAHNRVVAGVHYPSDLAAGRVSAAVIDNVLLHDPAFETDLAKSRAEVRRALGLSSQ
jgi:acid phosphatase (class A)